MFLAAVLVVAMASCSSDGEPEAGPSPTAASPSAAPPEPVRGEVTTVVDSADPGPIVFNDRAAAEPDQARIDAFADDITSWLDGHLTDLQAGGDGLLDDVAAPGLLGDAGDVALEAVTTDLASADRAVEGALYHVVVVHAGPPSFARVTVVTSTPGGERARAGLVFTPGPTLLAAGPESP